MAIRTTTAIRKSLHVAGDQRSNHKVAIAAALELPEVPFRLSPYVLGVWLGDGHSAAARLTCSEPEIMAAVQEEGLNATPVRAAGAPQFGLRFVDAARWQPGTWHNLQAHLGELGVLRNKHIPAAYLRGSRSQRLALLQGLMDTDGSVSPVGQCEFVSIRKPLADGVLELTRSLGLKSSMTVDRARLRGRDCGPRYRVQFWPTAAESVFRLRRKTARLTPRPSRSHAPWRYIVAVDPTPSVPVRCIEVDSPSHLYLAGHAMVPTHNTTFLINLFDSLVRRGWPTLYIGAGSEGPPKDLRRQWSALRCGYPVDAVMENRWDELPPKPIRGGEMADAKTVVFQDLEWQAVDCHETAHFHEAGEKLTPAALVDAMNYARRNKCRYVILDHIHRVRFNAGQDERRALADTTRWLRDMAAKYDMACFIAAQLHRAPGDKGPLRDLVPPTMDDLKGTGTLEEDAVVGLLLHRVRRAGTQAKDFADVLKNLKPVSDVVEPNTMCVRVGKHRRRGHAKDHAAFLSVGTTLEERGNPHGNGKPDPATATREREPGEDDLPF
jgi:replicative DNA helicase